MKVVILAGGLGTRLMEETTSLPKPMVEIGGKPILWHIMKIYEHQGFNEFIICLGYKGYLIKEYFLNYFTYNSDITVELKRNEVTVHYSNTESFKVTLVDTGLNTNTAGRIQKIKKYLDGERFMLTYGDGVADINLNELISFHLKKNKLVTLTSVRVPGRFGNLTIENNGTVSNFQEKPKEGDGEGVWVNAGFFICEMDVFKYLNGNFDEVQWEKGPLLEISKNGELNAYQHIGYWKCMDALRDKIELDNDWKYDKAKWKLWKD